MIDVHCHILPRIDDGPESDDIFVEMAKRAVEQGISHLFATPHHLNGSYENAKNKIVSQVRDANNRLGEMNIPLVIHLGQEIRIHREFFLSLRLDELLTYGDKGRYVLIEFPPGDVPDFSFEVFHELLVDGITPIIAHPERNRVFMKNPGLLYEFVEAGALTQLTAGSIIGRFGRRVNAFAWQIVQHKLAHFIASDAHNLQSRGFYLQEAYEAIKKICGINDFYYLLENTELLLKGDPVLVEKPNPIRKRILKLF